ncbi:MAG: Mannan polymerase II complex anp1 subunit [Watsoniomyces obsoletus]|nr:MAG: Mannan polymerase II complex anp1 subunit [Watsoniomyces obsoletus]
MATTATSTQSKTIHPSLLDIDPHDPMATNHTNNATSDAGARSNSTAAAGVNQDPFAAQRTSDNNPFAEQDEQDLRRGSSDVVGSPQDDASKVPPSRFQKREGSIYATPPSRDSHTDRTSTTKAFTEKLKEKGWM